jgi:pleiotropic regulator 1
MSFWDNSSGYRFQDLQTPVQPGSMESEAAIYGCSFDRSGTYLITAEGDKTIKMFVEDPESTPEKHPIKWVPQLTVRKW